MRNGSDDRKELRIAAYSILKLYNDAFIIGFPLLSLTLFVQIFFGRSSQIIALLLTVIIALLFFKTLKNNTFVAAYQIKIHQIFVFCGVVVSAAWFLTTLQNAALLYFIFVGSMACYLMIEIKTTVVYILVYHAVLVVFGFFYPIVKTEFILYSLIVSWPSFFVSKWLNELIEHSRSLESSKQKYRSLFENGNYAVVLLERRNDIYEICDTNTNSEGLFGYKRAELLNESFRSLSNETQERKEKLCHQIACLKDNDRFDVECVFTRKNGEEFYAETSFVAVNLNNKIIIQVLIHDISEKRKDEIKLSETIQSFKNIVENSPAGVFIFTDDELVYKNSKAERMYSEVLDHTQTNIFNIFPEEQKYILTELLQEVGDKESSYTEITLGTEGDEKRYSISLVKVVYNGKSSVLLVLLDITLQNEYNIQRIRAEIAEEINKKLSEEIENHRETQRDLIEKTSKLDALFESSSNLFILTIDRDLAISSFNSSFKKMMLEYLDVDVQIGDDFLKTFPIEGSAYGNLIKRFKRALRGDSVEVVSHFPTKKGEIWVESFISPVKVEGQPIKEIAFIAHNITEKVENERKVMDSEANNRATVSAIPDMLFKVNRKGYFTDYRLNEEGLSLLKYFAYTTDLKNKHITAVFKNQKQARIFFHNIEKALRTGTVHTQNFIIPFIIGKTDKKKVYENRYSRVNSTEVIVITRDVTDKVEFEARLIESVREKEILLKEVHHRVKNNLQVISSILNLQSSYVEDEKTLEIINESQNRIRSMSYIHESLYQTKDFSSIDFHDYITNLVQNLVHSYQLFSGKTTLKLDIDRVQLVLDQAIPCGLILNELVSNSLKYAYPEGGGGEIQIEIKEEDGKIKMRVEDFGLGLPQGFRIEDSESLGLGLVDTLVDQIDGELILKTDKGTKYLIIFEKQDL